MPDIVLTPEQEASLNADLAAPAAPTTPAPKPLVFTPEQTERLDALVKQEESNGPGKQEEIASEAFANTTDPDTDAVGAGLFRDGLGLFTVDNSYHNQAFASMFTAAKEVGYNHLFGLMDRLNTNYHQLDVRDGTEEYVKFINSQGLRDIDERLARPLKNAFIMHAAIRNIPLHGAYRATAAGSAGRKMLQQFVQKVADTGTPLTPEQYRAQKLLESMTNEEWEEAYRESVFKENPEAKNEQMRRLALKAGPASMPPKNIQQSLPTSVDQFDMHLRESATRFPQYTAALEQVMGPTWRKDFLAQYGTESMLMKSGMLRMRQPDGIGMPVASEISLDAAGMLTPIDLVAPGLVKQIIEDSFQKRGERTPGEVFDDSGELRFPDQITAGLSAAMRDPAYAAQDALTPFEKNLIGPVNGAVISVYKRFFEEIPAQVKQFSQAADANISALPFVQNAARGAVMRLTGDRDAAVATRRLSDAVQYFFRVSQEQGSMVDVLAQLSIAGANPGIPIQQEETQSFPAFRVLGAEERQAALKVFNTANAALAENFAAVDKMGEVGVAWWKGEGDGDSVRGAANLLAYGAGKLFQTAIIKPIADVVDDPHTAAVFGYENVAIGALAKGVFNARHALMGRLYRANKLDLYLRRLADTFPSEVRKIQGLAREEIKAAAKAGRSVDAAFDDVVAVAKATIDELEIGTLSAKTAATFADKVKNVWPSIGESMQPFSQLINSRFSPGGGVIENVVRKIAPNFRVRRVDKALLRSLAPELNDRTVRAITDIIGKANARGFTHSQQRSRVRLYKELTGKTNLTAAEKISVMNGDARALAEIAPRLNARRTQLDKMRVDLETQLKGLPNPAVATSYQTVVDQLNRISNIEQVWRGAVPQRDHTFLADLYRTIERIKSRGLPLHTRAVNATLGKVFGVNSVQGEFMYSTMENVMNTALDGAEAYAMKSRENAWKGAVNGRLYKVALEKARNVAETHETIEAGLRGLKDAGDALPPALEEDLARATSGAVQARADVRLLEAEYDRTFSANDRGETVFRPDPTKNWRITPDSQLFRWVNDRTLYTALRADPALARTIPEDLFQEVPAPIARVPERAADIDNGIRVAQQDVLRHQKSLAEPDKIDQGLKILEVRRDSAAAGEKRAAANAQYQVDTVTHGQWGERLEAAAQAGQLSKLEREVHGFIRNTLKSGEVDNWGRSVQAVQVLETQYADSFALAPADRKQALKIALHLKKRYNMEAPILPNRSAVGTQKWREFSDYQFDLGNTQPGVAAAAKAAYDKRLVGLKDGSIVSPSLAAARRAITEASDNLKSLYRRQAELADPSAYVLELTPTGRGWVNRVFNHRGVDELTEKTVQEATALAETAQALVQRQSGEVAAQIPFKPGGPLMRGAPTLASFISHLAGDEKVQVSTTTARTIQHNGAIHSVDLERLNNAYWQLPDSSRRLLGRAMREGVLPSEIVKKHPKFAKAYEAAHGRAGFSLDDLFQLDGNFQAQTIERLRRTGKMKEELYQDLLRAGYDPQMHFSYEMAKFIDDPIIRDVRAARAAGEGQRAQSKSGVDIDGLKFARSLDQYRLRVQEADGKIVHQMFDDEAALREHVANTYGPGAVPEGAIKGITRTRTKLGEELTLAEPLGPEAQKALDTIMGDAAVPEKRLLRWSELVRNEALHDYLTIMKQATGMVFDKEQMTLLELKHGPKVISDYVQLPPSRSHFGNLAGHFVHKRVLADLNAMSHSYRQIESWLGGIREAFELFDASVPNEILRKTTSFAGGLFGGINRLARYNLIHLSLKTRLANHTSAMFSDHFLGTRLFSIRNLDVREMAIEHIFKNRFEGRLPDEVYKEFVQHGFLDQGFEARNWSAPEVDAMKRMMHLPKNVGFLSLLKDTLGVGEHAAAGRALKGHLAKRKALLDQKLALELQGKDPGLLSQIEQQVVALDSVIAKLDEGYAKALGHEAVGFFGTAGSQDIFRSSAQLAADRFRERYNAIDTFYKYAFYRVLRDKMGVPREQAGDLIRRYTQQFRDLPPVLHRVQDSPLGSFVVGFPYEMLRITGNAMKDRPGRLAAWLATIPALNFSMSAAAGINPDRQMKHIQALGWRDRSSALRHYMSTLIVPNNKGEISTTIDFSNTIMPMAQLVFGENTMRHVYDNLTDEDPKTRPIFWDLLGWGASVGGAFVGNNPVIDTIATSATGRNPRTGQPIFKDPEQGGLWDKFVSVGKMISGQYLSPHFPAVGRDWQNLSEAYEAGLDPVTRRVRGLTPGDAASRMAWNLPIKGDFARFVEKGLGAVGMRGAVETLAGPGKQLSEAGAAVRSKPTAADDMDIVRSIIFRAADLNGSGEKIRAMEDAPRKQAADLYFRAAQEGNQPEIWERIGKLLTVPTTSKQEMFGPTETTRRSAPEIAADLVRFGRKGWDDQYSVLDPEEKVVAMIQADIAGVKGSFLKDMARLYVETDMGNERRGKDPKSLVKFEAAKKRIEQWIGTSRARREFFTTPGTPDVMSIMEFLDTAIEESRDAVEYELDAQIKGQERDIELGRPQVRP